MKYQLAALAVLCIFVIVGIGRVSYASGDQSAHPSHLNAATTGTVSAATQTPQSDGTIIHTVRKGETIDSIAAAYSIPVKQIRDYNNIPNGGVSVGQHLLISIAYPTTLPANATVVVVTATYTPNVQFVVVTSTNTANPNEPTATLSPPTATATPQPTATAVPPSPTPHPSATLASVVSKASVCVTAFQDANTNHWFDNDEKRLAGMKISLAPTDGTPSGTAAGSAQGNYEANDHEFTTSADGATCINDVPVGDFTVSATAPDGFGLTTPAKFALSLTAGAQLSLSFGAAPGYQPRIAATGSSSAASAATSTPAASAGILSTVASNIGVIVLAVAGIILIGGLGVIALARRL